MKRLNLLLAGLVCFASVSCSDDDKTSAIDNTSAKAIESTMVKGSWRITSFKENGTDETANFAGYKFTFKNTDNPRVIAVTNGTNNYSATWWVNISNDNDGGNNSNFVISFNNPEEFEVLNGDWDIVSRSGNTFNLEETNEDGTVDHLSFAKN